MAVRECGDCYYYEKCDSEECPADKPLHGFCYVNPPESVRGSFGTGADEIEFDVEINNFCEVPADRPGCRFWEQ